MPLMHEHRREVSASRSVRCSYTTCLLAYTTRESAGVRGFALFGISNTVFLFACGLCVVRVGGVLFKTVWLPCACFPIFY